VSGKVWCIKPSTTSTSILTHSTTHYKEIVNIMYTNKYTTNTVVMSSIPPVGKDFY